MKRLAKPEVAESMSNRLIPVPLLSSRSVSVPGKITRNYPLCRLLAILYRRVSGVMDLVTKVSSLRSSRRHPPRRDSPGSQDLGHGLYANFAKWPREWLLQER